MERVRKLEIGGHRDWRLPSKAEAEQFSEFVNTVMYADMLRAEGFDNVQLGWYMCNGGENTGWLMLDSQHSIDSIGFPAPSYVWPVRSGQ